MVGWIYTPRSSGRSRPRPGASLGTNTYLVLATASLWTIAFLIRAQLPAAANVTLLGKIFDMSCYAAQESAGDARRECGRPSGANRSPAGLLASDGIMYLLMDNPANALQRTLLPGGSLVRVTGKLIKRGGLSMLAVTALHKA